MLFSLFWTLLMKIRKTSVLIMVNSAIEASQICLYQSRLMLQHEALPKRKGQTRHCISKPLLTLPARGLYSDLYGSPHKFILHLKTTWEDEKTRRRTECWSRTHHGNVNVIIDPCHAHEPEVHLGVCTPAKSWTLPLHLQWYGSHVPQTLLLPRRIFRQMTSVRQK